ncbi:IPT/TIG domain-containing protein [Salegentibacter sp. 24]|uniref:LamG-like jellyroll fold domain-containing protein n=1 Tax=Salegentibacter sp. 24 TaxID=2183986 RepID=UPI0010622B14|nr:LamG-like jellyroll fold domain-containing protein [Salegentibacter sp. 24]TDN88827.1 IPT/TIG domain-containing protein [Salegentibacter sp. 24]
MKNSKTLFYLGTDRTGIFDGSLLGQKVSSNSKVKNLKREGAIQFNQGGTVSLDGSKELENLSSFTIETTIRPKSLGQRMNITEAQKPAIAFFIEDSGKLVGSIHTKDGWQSVDSNQVKISTSKEQHVKLIKDKTLLTLEIDGKEVGKRNIDDPIKPVGEKSFFIGSWIDGKRHSFSGTMAHFRIQKGAITNKTEKQLLSKQNQLQAKFKNKFRLPNLNVFINPDESYARLRTIKNILTAVGVIHLSDLSSLNITSKTVMTRGKVLIAPKIKDNELKIDWSKLAKNISSISTKEKQLVLAKNLLNNNSVKFIKNKVNLNNGSDDRGNIIRTGRTVRNIGPFERRVIGRVSRESQPFIRAENINLSHAVNLSENNFTLKDRNILSSLKKIKPETWPSTAGNSMKLLSMTTLPIDTAVIIAGTFNLKDTELVIEPEVETLYIIAEKIECSPSSKITWRRPGGTTPSRANNPDLNGRGYSGVHQKPNSYDGLDGENGRSGQSGINGAAGISAPKLEIWVKDMNAMPNLDLNGEDGIKGGRGQKGGNGGNGADGRVGRIRDAWVHKWCYKDPGDGGDGGNGGRGGDGGRGGSGGDGGNITIGVLEGTLEAAVTSQSFRIKNQGGQKGRGGDGGTPGNGGRGGRSGVGQYCTDADDGHNGSTGQPGNSGQDGFDTGGDGKIDFVEFSEDAWEDILTQPFISDIEPDYIFPSDTLNIKGTRFTSNDKVFLDSHLLAPTVNADESLTITVPAGISGGEKIVYIKRQDGTESNRLRIWIKPQLNIFTGVLMPGNQINISGKAFLNGALVIVNAEAVPANYINANTLSFQMPGTGGAGNTQSLKSLQVKNPDGMMSNIRTAYSPDILEIPFQFPLHSFEFKNFDDGSPSWNTYLKTFGEVEVWHEQLDPIFGHPVLTTAFYGFYNYFLKGESNGGLATGFCTALSAIVLDELWQGSTNTFSKYGTNPSAEMKKMFTAIHGKLLSRESLIEFHDQGRQGNARVIQTYREIEHVFFNGCDRNNAPMLFFIPSGAIWDAGYIDKLGETHCIVPIRFVYPEGHSGPRPDGTTDPDRVRLYCWDCNHPYDPDPTVNDYENCYVEFRRTDGEIRFDYYDGGTTRKFCSEEGITLGIMSNGDFHIADHDLPFSGPLGLTSFVIDFLLSPADLQVTDEFGLRTGLFGNQIIAEIPESKPCFLAKGAYLLPSDTALTRKITGNGSGIYTYNSITPNGTSLVIEDMETTIGQEDILAVNSDGTQVRFTPGAHKNFKLTVARKVNDQIRAVAIEGIGGGPSADVDITLSPELSLCRIGNQSSNKTINVRAFTMNSLTQAHSKLDRGGVGLPSNHDLVLAITDWENIEMSVESVPFE